MLLSLSPKLHLKENVWHFLEAHFYTFLPRVRCEDQYFHVIYGKYEAKANSVELPHQVIVNFHHIQGTDMEFTTVDYLNGSALY